MLPNNVEPFPKNPHLAQLFTQLRRSEELGTGLRNVYKYSKAYSGSENISFIEDNTFVVNVPLTLDAHNDTDKRTNNLLILIKGNRQVTISKIVEILNISKSTVIRDLNKLKKKGRLKRIGTEKTGHWEILNP